MNNILLVEDNMHIQEVNKFLLERSGYRVNLAMNLTQARQSIREELPDLIVLDIMLPDGNGLDFLHELRETSNVPVMMLTAMDTPESIIRGLEAGGDDYLTKPYDLKMFITRLETLMRRASLMPETLSMGSVKLDTASQTAFLNGEDMLLSKREYAVLQLFVQHPEKMMNADYLYEKAWGQEMHGDDSSFKTIISRLRKKLSGSGFTIASERGEGYVLERE
jgi:DNA-binding response OmpR family regulator